MQPSTQPLVVILTHEHTDFDALASLLAAARLYPHSVPILPRQMNRNLEAFLADYAELLPFVRQDDLPKRRIDEFIAVDTQTVQPVRGMSAQATGLIIDHHPLMRELPAGWSFWGEETGATTTLLVERLAEHGGTLKPVEATLLMLGIYEDTGALSYSTTTPRDMRAAAWLLERGANLLVVNRFLHHPLTEEQQQLYQQLADSAQPYQFQGHAVIIASASVAAPVEEISTLAHKLYDLYEPDGLFILVEMGNYLQMVARSTNDAIDVGKIAASFGGGGHSRAAAALVRDNSLPSVFESLVYALQSQIRPNVTVSQIMSYGTPQTLAPTDTIATAAERGQRYGFEGFPVVEGSRIVGMLTRREIDRAVHHGLEGHTVRRYMRVGEVYVTPEDSVATLRKVMSDHDWGQVPVLHAQTGALLGIVTRTDLIKQGSAVSAGPESLADTMERALPAALLDLLRQVGAVAGDLGYPLYVVGGFVRDLLLGQPNFDVDLVVEGDAIRLAQLLAQRAGGRVRSHRRFGTAKWILPESGKPADGILPDSLDFVTARTEFYEHPTALPTVERSSIKQDLHRRDFTINTLAMRLTPDRWGELLDAYGGRRDLEDGIIRVLHSLSFVEDPTRILRAARFEQRFQFHIEPRTEELIGGGLDLLERVSAERIRHELELILAEVQPERSLCRLAELGVLVRLHPALRCDTWFIEKSAALRAAWDALPSDSITVEVLPRLYLALLTYGLEVADLTEFIEKFRIRKEYRDLALEVHRLAACLPQLSVTGLRPSEVVKLLDESSAGARLVLHVAADDEVVRRNLDRYEHEWQYVHPVLTGDDLRKLGLPPGRVYRAVLDRIRTARLDGEIATRVEEEALARQAMQAARV
jgi:tRNA nucleotidyltransferase (CCA-adding enzyme)